ncbi:MAG: adenosylcobinamide amidohydrolase [Methanomassiliicoccaceae archaeon]|nr:adenosylcobinamide amidohydrolase [Methanomassiliicoccaceae archaeon]
MNRREEACGGFVVETGSSSIVITHPGGRWSAMSSSEGAGYSESPERIVLTNDASEDGGFAIRAAPPAETASLASVTHIRTSVSALAVADPRPDAHNDCGHGVSVVLMVDADLPPATMARAAVTSTEAVTCAFQQLMIGRPDRKEIASGSDSLCITVLSNTSCGRRLYNAGKHSKLGELIGRAVIEATLSSMGKNGATPGSQADVFKRLERFGVTNGSCREYLAANGLDPGKGFDEELERISKDKAVLSYVSAVLQIADGISFGVIPPHDGYEAGRDIIHGTISRNASSSGDLIQDLVSALSMKALRGGFISGLTSCGR